MARKHNLSTVIWFEFIRTIKKKSFWLTTLAMPLLIAAIFGITYISSKIANDQSSAQKNDSFSIAYTDESGIIVPEIMKSAKATLSNSQTDGIQLVKSGQVDAYFNYQKDVAKNGVLVYGKDEGIFKNQKYGAVAEALLQASAETRIGNPELASVAKTNPTVTTTTFKGSLATSGWQAMIVPIIFLAIFYLVITMLGNNLLNSTVEEKENRVTEMILTTLNPTTLITGKLIATFLAGLLQIIVLLIPLVIAFVGFRTNLSLPNLDLSHLVFDPQAILLGSLILAGGLLLFTGSLVAIGAIMPTAKEAGQWFSIIILAVFIPLYIMPLIMSDPGATAVQVLLYFPLSSPITALLMNAFGSLSLIQGLAIGAELIIIGILMVRLAVHLFRYGAMSYSNRLSLATIFHRKSTLKNL